MSKAFGFFLRLFLCFVGARFLLQAVDVPGRAALVGLTLLFLANVYWFSHLIFRDRKAAPADVAPPPSPPAAAPAAEAPPVDPPPPQV
jgi:hypothetical protein